MEILQLFKDSLNSPILSFLIDNVSDAIILTDYDLIIKSCNRTAENIYGWKVEEIVGKKIYEISSMEFLNCSIEEFRKELFEVGKWQGEFKQKGKGGREIHFFSSFLVIKNIQANIIGVLAINSDIKKKIPLPKSQKILMKCIN